MESLVRWCLKNKSVVILATVLLIGSGAYATARLNQELLPDISFPIITISTPVVGAGPDVVDEQVTQPVESAISGVAEIEAVQSTSSQGSSVVVVEFDLDALFGAPDQVHARHAFNLLDGGDDLVLGVLREFDEVLVLGG